MIETFPGAPLDNDYSMNVADICPVGALTTKDFRFKIRVWFLDDVPGVCTGCANGCNIHLGVANNKRLPLRAAPQRRGERHLDVRRGPHVVQGDRRARPDAPRARARRARRAGGMRVSRRGRGGRAQRLARVRDAKGAGAIAGIASPHATNEDLLRVPAPARGAGRRWRAGVAVPRGRADGKLIKAEKAANGAGARALGFGDAAALCERIRSGGGGGADRARPRRARRRLSRRDRRARAASTRSSRSTVTRPDLQRVAHVLFPTRVAAEKHGTLTNHAGRVQTVEPAVEPAFDARSEGEVLAALGAALGLPGLRRPLRRARGLEGARAERARVRQCLARRGRARRRAAGGSGSA